MKKRSCPSQVHEAHHVRARPSGGRLLAPVEVGNAALPLLVNARLGSHQCVVRRSARTFGISSWKLMLGFWVCYRIIRLVSLQMICRESKCCIAVSCLQALDTTRELRELLIKCSLCAKDLVQ